MSERVFAGVFLLVALLTGSAPSRAEDAAAKIKAALGNVSV
jgi:hypothetical protein